MVSKAAVQFYQNYSYAYSIFHQIYFYLLSLWCGGVLPQGKCMGLVL